MASAPCAKEAAPNRLLRLGCSGVAVVMAGLFILASAVRAFHAVTAHEVLTDVLLVSAASVLTLATLFGLSDPKRGRFLALLVGVGSLFVLGLSSNSAGSALSALTGPLPMAMLIAGCMVSTQIGAKLAQSAACSCE